MLQKKITLQWVQISIAIKRKFIPWWSTDYRLMSGSIRSIKGYIWNAMMFLKWDAFLLSLSIPFAVEPDLLIFDSSQTKFQFPFSTDLPLETPLLSSSECNLFLHNHCDISSFPKFRKLQKFIQRLIFNSRLASIVQLWLLIIGLSLLTGASDTSLLFMNDL